MYKRIIQLIITTYSCVLISSPHLNISQLSINNGLPGTSVRQIIKDRDGYIWFATSSGLARYDGYEVKAINDNSGDSLGDVWSILSEPNGSIIIASDERGMFRYHQGKVERLNYFKNKTKVKIIFRDSVNNIWIGASTGLYKLVGNKIISINDNGSEIFSSIINWDNQNILVATTNNIYKINIETNQFSIVNVESNHKKKNFRLYKDGKDKVWLGREDGLFLYDAGCNCFNNFKKIKSRVYSFASSNEYLWIGTLFDGLYRFHYSTQQLINFSSDADTINGLTDNTILSLYSDQSNVLWIGTFYTGVNFVNINSSAFNTYPNTNNMSSCNSYTVIQDIFQSKDSAIWLATEKGLVKILDNRCTSFIFDKNNNNSLSSDLILSISQSSDSNIWVTNSQGGIDSINPITNQVERKGKEFPHLSFYFSTEFKKGHLLLGSFNNGLYAYNIAQEKLKKIEFTGNKEEQISFFYYSLDQNNDYYFATSRGIAKFKNNELEFLKINLKEVANTEITTLTFDQDNNLWFGFNNQYLMKTDLNGEVENINSHIFEKQQHLSVSSLVSTNDNTIWASTNKGLLKINTQNYNHLQYTEHDGAFKGDYLNNSYWYDEFDNIYFGGKTGALNFNLSKIKINDNEPNVVLTSFNYFNKRLEFGGKTETGLMLNSPINDLTELTLGYQDYIIGFEFAALDYADSMRNQYTYRLEGFDNDWVHTDASNRQATYTNLKPGEYTFQVKASNKDGVWSKNPKELKITVHPAPWFSPWAYFIYFITIVFSIWAFIRYKTIASRKRAKQLEITVVERTHEVTLQKKMVESLLDYKNEVFANITHEFKTPLALILGPTEQLVNEPELTKHSDKLNMIQRNSKRLLLMVGQILKLSQAELDKEVLRESQSVKAILLMLHESFLPLADNKNINMALENNHNVNIYATAECLEIVVGNLLSNALKFTNSGGQISIQSTVVNNNIEISIKDTGSGIDSKDLDKIFKRFTRLDTHKSIAGTGIGLSVVKEISQANNGEIKVESEWGKGSLFTVVFPISDVVNDSLIEQKGGKNDLFIQLVENTQNELKTEKSSIQLETHKNRISILIIEDNLDMQTHIGSVLNHRFNCYFADQGRKGIATALKEMPDIVICDVMMPGMDGYQVTRILRHDGKTSHIPIILLTALNTKESRIKGWRENIDTYIAKPFDALELNVQIDNILSMRKLLQKKTNAVIQASSSTSVLDLPKKDMIFVEKLQDVIGKYYTNEYFQKADLASKMAVSERHLHRKIKALVGESPMDMLRGYRLEKSAIKLKDGYQVGLTSDECGFSSVSYFGSCFKKKYGITPKQYQNLNYKQ